MLTYAVIAAMGLAGYWGAPWWLVLVGAAVLTAGAWWSRILQLGRESRAPWSSKTRTYFVTGVVVDVVLAGLCFGAGRIVRAVIVGIG
jgi:hypothetical protein